MDYLKASYTSLLGETIDFVFPAPSGSVTVGDVIRAAFHQLSLLYILYRLVHSIVIASMGKSVALMISLYLYN